MIDINKKYRTGNGFAVEIFKIIPDAAKKQNQQKTADICRKYLTLGDLQ